MTSLFVTFEWLSYRLSTLIYVKCFFRHSINAHWLTDFPDTSDKNDVYSEVILPMGSWLGAKICIQCKLWGHECLLTAKKKHTDTLCPATNSLFCSLLLRRKLQARPKYSWEWQWSPSAVTFLYFYGILE